MRKHLTALLLTTGLAALTAAAQASTINTFGRSGTFEVTWNYTAIPLTGEALVSCATALDEGAVCGAWGDIFAYEDGQMIASATDAAVEAYDALGNPSFNGEIISFILAGELPGVITVNFDSGCSNPGLIAFSCGNSSFEPVISFTPLAPLILNRTETPLPSALLLFTSALLSLFGVTYGRKIMQ